MKKIYLIDWNSFIYRMFFALPEFSTKDWEIVNALFGMAKFFVWQLIRENPDYLVFVKDAVGDNFRHKLYWEYKATRDKMPDNLKTQISLIEDMIQKMWIEIIEISWYEADDVIWTLANNLWKDVNNDVYILSWDKDLYSLTKDNVKIYDTMKQKIYDYNDASKKFWIKAPYIIDYLAIVWDKSDNIPGVEWFWPKKAIDLINKYWTLEEIYLHIEDKDFIIWWKTLEKLKDQKDNAFLSKKLATIELAVDLWDFDIKNFCFKKSSIVNEDVVELFKKYDFNSLLSDKDRKDLDTFSSLDIKKTIIQNDEELQKLQKILDKQTEITLDTETTSLDVYNASLVWISILIWDNIWYYINYWHNQDKVSYNKLKDFLLYLLNSDKMIIWHNLKYDLEIIELFLKWEHNNKKELESWQKSLF